MTLSWLMADIRLTEYYSLFTSDFFMASCSAMRPYLPSFRYRCLRTSSSLLRDGGASAWQLSSSASNRRVSLFETPWRLLYVPSAWLVYCLVSEFSCRSTLYSMGVRPVCLSTVGLSLFKAESCYEFKFTLWTSSSSNRLRKLLSLPAL